MSLPPSCLNFSVHPLPVPHRQATVNPVNPAPVAGFEETMGNIRDFDPRSTDRRKSGRSSVAGRSTDRRREPRTVVDLSLMVWGVDVKGERFLQEARARDISRNGAMLSGLDAELRSGDVVGVLYAAKKARFRVIWVRYDETGDKMQVAIHRLTADECPWLALLGEEPAKIESQPGAEAT